MRLLTGLLLVALSCMIVPSSASEMAKLTGLNGTSYEAIAASIQNMG